MLETLDDPTAVIAELRRITKHGGVVGAASVEYDGVILAGEPTEGTRRFYNIRQQLWRAAGIADPNMGRRLRGLFQAAGFGHVEAFAEYISYGTPERVRAFASDRAGECRDRELHAAVTRYGIASTEELLHLAAAWEKWGDDPSAPSLPSRGVGCWLGASNTAITQVNPVTRVVTLFPLPKERRAGLTDRESSP
jgi:hypothetical protein